MSTISENLRGAFLKFISEPALIGAALAFVISAGGNIYQYFDKKTELEMVHQQNELALSKTRVEVEKLTIETKDLKEKIASRTKNISQYQAEIDQLKSVIKSDEYYLLKHTADKTLTEGKIDLYTANQKVNSADAERKNLQLIVNEIQRLEKDKAEKMKRLQDLEGLVNK